MSGTTEGGKKAAETRGHESLSEAGKKGGQATNQQSAAKTQSPQRQNQTDRQNGERSQRGKSQKDNR